MEAREREMWTSGCSRTLAGGAWGRYRELVDELAEEHDPLDLAAAAHLPRRRARAAS